MSRIAVGIPCFQNYAPEVAHDYMRMWYHFGRRMPQHDFFLIAKTKSEQFRARNSIVTTALQFGCDYLLFLDDDHIFDWKELPTPESYDFLETLIAHDKDIVGCLYYHRTGKYRPVLMKKIPGDTKAYTFMADDEITGELQRVDVQGGGVMLIKMKIFDKMTPPYFEPEMQTDGDNYGTDIQLCRKATAAGFEVWCDTSIVVGHLKQEREIVHGENRDSFIADNALKTGIAEDWVLDSWLKDYRDRVREYTGLGNEDIVEKAVQYNEGRKGIREYVDKKEYYRSLGIEQVCRQCFYHSRPAVAQESLVILKTFKRGFRGHGVDVGCGTAPVGYELLRLGHQIDFVDIDGAEAYEFTKWRVGKADEPMQKRAGWSLSGPYDFALCLDSIEHIEDWRETLDDVIGRIKERGVLITNYFGNQDYNNPEHISMDHKAVADFMASRGMVPKSNMIWIKDDNFMGGAMGTKQESAA